MGWLGGDGGISIGAGRAGVTSPPGASRLAPAVPGFDGTSVVDGVEENSEGGGAGCCARPATGMAAANARATHTVLPAAILLMLKVFGWNHGDFKPTTAVCRYPGAVLARDRVHEAAMIDALQLLMTRRSVKPMELGPPGPTAAEIDTLLTIAANVPDHGKLTPLRFIVFEGDARIAAGATIAAAFKADHPQATADQVEFERNRLARAPLVIAVVSRAAPHVKIPEWEQQLSAGAASMSLVIAAHALGYAASWITEWYAYDARVTAALGVAANERIAGFVHIGKSARAPEDRPRPAVADIVTRYGG